MRSALAASNMAMASSRTAGTVSALSCAALTRNSVRGSRLSACMCACTPRGFANHGIAVKMSPNPQLPPGGWSSEPSASFRHVARRQTQSHFVCITVGSIDYLTSRKLSSNGLKCCSPCSLKPSHEPSYLSLSHSLTPPFPARIPQPTSPWHTFSPFKPTKSSRSRIGGVTVLASESSRHSSPDGAASGTASQKTKFTVTTPLYYVNAAPHMGSAYPTIAADALARFQRLQGREVVFVTGTDEHGEKIALAAAANGRSPTEHVDLVAEDYRALWKEFAISNDRFIRTTSEQHEKIVAEFFQRVWANGDIYRAVYEGLYCVACEEYKDEKELLEGQCCPTHRKPCVERKEDNYFFALSKYQKALEELFEANPDFVRPSYRKNEVLGWVSEGLRDFSISRAAVEWGIPVPADPKQTIYVWFDALLGYLTALLPEGQEPTLANILAGGHWPASVHIIGKDILRFHAVYWPAMLMSAGLPVPQAVYGHGFLTKDGLKMGKSLGNTIAPQELVARFGPDAVRYFFLREIEFGRDGDYAEERFINMVNASLANTIGNLLNRTLGLLKKNCGAAIPIDTASIPEDHPLRQLTADSVVKAREGYESINFAAACEAALGLATAGNLYMDEKAPWAQFKKGAEEQAAAARDLAVILEVVRVAAILLAPITPGVSTKIHLQLGYSEADFHSLTWEQTQWGGLREGQAMAEPSPVFQRIEEPLKDDSTPPPQKGGGKKGGKSKQKANEEARVVASS